MIAQISQLFQLYTQLKNQRLKWNVINYIVKDVRVILIILIYGEKGMVLERLDEAGSSTMYAYNENHLLGAVTDAKGDTVYLGYDEDCNLSKVTLPDGATSEWKYDHLGNCVSQTNPLGAINRYEYDGLNRVIRSYLADGNEIKLKYDGYGSVLHVKDTKTEVYYTYTANGQVKTRQQGNRKVQLKYDDEEHLVQIINEKGETYEFERDAKHNVVKETAFDGITRTYERDYSGLVTKINRPSDRWTTYDYDRLGRVVGVNYYDSTSESFVYNKNGALTETKNNDVTLKFEYDVTGRLIKEMQNDYVVESIYDEVGNRTFITSSLGANIAIAHNSRGQATHLAASQGGKGWVARREYNELGQEIERMLPGNVISSSSYDVMGRVTSHRVSSGGHDIRRNAYKWDVNRQLKVITDELTQKKTAFFHNQFSELVRAEYGHNEIIYRRSDDVGNIYERDDQSDRIYGKGSRLEQSGVNTNELKNKVQGGYGKLVTKGAEYKYDGEGNLIKKTEAPDPDRWLYGDKGEKVYQNGATWQYEYYGNGMLKQVIKPDGEVVTYKYDSLGRRIEKSSNANVIKFVWDGNNPLHEWEEKPEIKRSDSLVTWVFGDSTFSPSAKLTSQGNYSIISDYLGTSVEAYDEDGKKVWEQQLDIYGRIRKRAGRNDEGVFDSHFVPFRYQGQYHDQETELYYNRFRYYDPQLGHYITQDPIGLAGGNPTLYGYVSDPNGWIDPLGLCTTESKDTGSTKKVASNSTVKTPAKGTGGGKPNGIGNSVETNTGKVLDTTPSSNHMTVTKNPAYQGTPNSSVDILDDVGNATTRRWFGSDGKAIRDIDITNHGNPKTHPEWPHEHIWKYGADGKPTGR